MFICLYLAYLTGQTWARLDSAGMDFGGEGPMANSKVSLMVWEKTDEVSSTTSVGGRTIFLKRQRGESFSKDSLMFIRDVPGRRK
jgi:hypothetical protein